MTLKDALEKNSATRTMLRKQRLKVCKTSPIITKVNIKEIICFFANKEKQSTVKNGSCQRRQHSEPSGQR